MKLNSSSRCFSFSLLEVGFFRHVSSSLANTQENRTFGGANSVVSISVIFMVSGN